MSSQVEHTLWQVQNATPAAIEEAMRLLERERATDGSAALPARALNMVIVVDAEFAGEVTRRLEAVGRNQPSRTILLKVDPKRTNIGARIAINEIPGAGEVNSTHESLTVEIGERHIEALRTVVDPMVLTDVSTMLWAPHKHFEAIRVLAPLAQSYILDSSDEDDIQSGLELASSFEGLDRLNVIDLSWLRGAPWRLRLAAAFEPATRRHALHQLSGAVIRHQPGSEAAAALVLGWLAARLGWTVDGETVRSHTGIEIKLELQTVNVGVSGLAGVTLSTTEGGETSFDRNPGGLRASYMAGGEEKRSWTVLGGSRGEGGILATALRQGLVSERGYGDALAAAKTLLPTFV